MRHLLFLAKCILLVGCILLPINNICLAEEVEHAEASISELYRQYGNILIKWEPSKTDVSLRVTITIGTALIEVMHFTPDTLKYELDYTNLPQSATGAFLVEFSATGAEGKLYCKNFKWQTISNNGDVTGLIGIWKVEITK
jgi:hypothetical protein